MRFAHVGSRSTRLVEALCRYFVGTPRAIARALATAFVAGNLEVEELVQRGRQSLGRTRRWLRPLAERVATAFAGRPRPRKAALTGFILADGGFRRICRPHSVPIAPALVRPMMAPIRAAESWGLPTLNTPGDLAASLGISPTELDWFADAQRLERQRSRGRLRHYWYRPLTKRFGRVRLIEAPKPRLKQIQRRILTDILNLIPPHGAAHGFRRGRSIQSFARPHVGRAVVVKLDLQDFFPSIPVARVHAVFRAAGYPEPIADLLTGLCTNSVPFDVWDDDEDSSRTPESQLREARWRYARPHLPQGAPTSPALANLCAYRLDCRLSGLAESVGADYTRYADDLAFSGGDELRRNARRFALHVCAIVIEEGFTVHHRKTRVMRQGVPQRLAGMIVNERLNVARVDFDQLKAILTNCIRLGPQSQNRNSRPDFRQHLQGRVSFVESLNPEKGCRLRGLLDQIEW